MIDVIIGRFLAADDEEVLLDDDPVDLAEVGGVLHQVGLEDGEGQLQRPGRRAQTRAGGHSGTHVAAGTSGVCHNSTD